MIYLMALRNLAVGGAGIWLLAWAYRDWRAGQR